jgi:hypothetical protein
MFLARHVTVPNSSDEVSTGSGSDRVSTLPRPEIASQATRSLTLSVLTSS